VAEFVKVAEFASSLYIAYHANLLWFFVLRLTTMLHLCGLCIS